MPTGRKPQGFERRPRRWEGELGVLLQNAMRAKTREIGTAYTLRNLEEASGISHTYAAKQMAISRALQEGKEPKSHLPSRDIVEAWARALAPHLNLDEALMAAGYMPEMGTKQRLYKWIGRISLDQAQRLADLARVAQIGEPVPDLTPITDAEPTDQASAT